MPIQLLRQNKTTAKLKLNLTARKVFIPEPCIRLLHLLFPVLWWNTGICNKRLPGIDQKWTHFLFCCDKHMKSWIHNHATKHSRWYSPSHTCFCCDSKLSSCYLSISWRDKMLPSSFLYFDFDAFPKLQHVVMVATHWGNPIAGQSCRGKLEILHHSVKLLKSARKQRHLKCPGSKNIQYQT